MVKNGQIKKNALIGSAGAVREVSYRPGSLHSSAIEVTTIARLRRTGGTKEFASAQRPRFHLLIVVTAGAAVHSVDFCQYSLLPGTVLWVHPGQVQQWGEILDFEATVILFESSSLASGLASRVGELDQLLPLWRLTADQWLGLQGLLSAMQHVESYFTSGEHQFHSYIVEHLLSAILFLLLGIEGDRPTTVKSSGEVFHKFRHEVELHYRKSHSVDFYARNLGYSPRTLTRASLEAAGKSAKKFIDARIILEAKRLLAHTEDPVAKIGRVLGFDDSANFTKFFTLREGMVPLEFRRSVVQAGDQYD
ncbi:MAG: helix-turn-helix domain-containing protein [Mycobacteriaceae bacterium]